MQRINPDGATVDERKFTEGNPAQGVPATVVTDDWLNDVQEEIVNVVEGGGLELDGLDQTQLLQAVQQIAANQSRVETDYIDARAFMPVKDGDCPLGVYETPGGRRYTVRDFSHTDDMAMDISYPMPESWDRGEVKLKIRWVPGDGAAAGDDVVFLFHGGAVSDGESLDVALTSGAGVADVVTAEGNFHLSPPSAALTVEYAPILGDELIFQLTRDVSEGATPMAADCRVIGAWIQYTCNQPVAKW